MSKPKPDRGRRVFLLKQLREWHWISSAVCLICLIGFAITGVTLNHAGQIQAKPKTVEREAVLPADLVKALTATPADPKAPLPAPVAAFLRKDLSIKAAGNPAEWSDDEVYVDLPRPGGDASVTIERATGQVAYEKTTRGWVAFFNDLHKGRNTGGVWSWFIDIFAVACLVFSLTGLWLLYLLSATRKMTWPLVGAGLVVPAVLAILFLHL